MALFSRRRDQLATVVIVSDLHINSTVALSAPSILLDDGQEVVASKAQAWIRRCWLDFWAKVDKLPRPRYVVVNGEGVDGIHHGTTQLMCYREAEQVSHAVRVMRPIAEDADFLFWLRGTEAHSGKLGQWDEDIADRLGAVPDEDRNTASWWHLPLEVERATFDIMHHPQTFSRRPWTMDSAAARQASITWDEYHEIGEQPPDVVIRSHVHQFAKGWRDDTFCAFTPPWQLTTGFGRRLGTGRRVTPLGGLVFQCQDGCWRWPDGMKHPAILYRPSVSRRWVSPSKS